MSAELILVAPVLDEEQGIDAFLERVWALEGPGAPSRVVIVDDGSTDATCERVRAFPRMHPGGPELRLVRLSRNFGHQNAVLAGLAAARDWAARAGDGLVAVVDADLQDRPEDLAALVGAIEAGADVAYAVRATRGEGLLFRLFAGSFHAFLARFSRIPLPRDAGTFSVLRTEVVGAILDNADRSPYFPGLRAWVGYRQQGVPLDRDARGAGISRVGTLGLIRLALGAILGYSDLPLRLLGLLGVVILALSTFAAVAILVLRIVGMVELQGIALIIASIFFSLGVQSIYLMLIAYFLSRSASEASAKRPFLVMSDEEIL